MNGISAFHRVSVTHVDLMRKGFSFVRVWHVETVNTAVSCEINTIVDGYVSLFTENKVGGIPSADDRNVLTVSVRYSRTGIEWMSFLVQARLENSSGLIEQEFAARTFDMSSGKRICFSDLFTGSEKIWDTIAERVKNELYAYFPDDAHDEEAVNLFCRKERLYNAEFTLHGFSAVLHYPMRHICSDRRSLAEITLMYSELRPFMTEQALKETDNLAYYKTCALTFDDGPSRHTPILLDTLLEMGVRATFFVMGEKIKEDARVIMREQDEGHAIGAHNWNHESPGKLGKEELRRIKQRCGSEFVSIIGKPPKYTRAPHGQYQPMIDAKTGWPIVLWSIDTKDWRKRGIENEMETIRRKAENGDIILCHDSLKNAPRLVLRMVRYLTEKGFMLLTVDELFAREGLALLPDHKYNCCKHGRGFSMSEEWLAYVHEMMYLVDQTKKLNKGKGRSCREDG